MKPLRYTINAVAIVSAAFCVGSASAAAVSAGLSGDHAYVGMPVTLYVSIQNASSHEPPRIPAVDGLDIRSAGVPSRQSSYRNINGRVTSSQTLTYAYQVTPRRAGVFTVPAFDIKADGQTTRTNPMTLRAEKSEVGDLMFVEISGQKDRVYVGQALPLTLRIWIKPYTDESLGVSLGEGDMWGLISRHTDWGAFAQPLSEMAAQRQRPGGREVVREDANGQPQTYYLYEIEHEIYPDRPGSIDQGQLTVVAMYPTGLSAGRDFFGRTELSLAGARPLVLTAEVRGTEVEPIPVADRPATFHGTVGERFQIAADATPWKVTAGDPIALRLAIQGDGRMELLQAPPLSRIDALTENFRVPNEALAGIARGDTKFFTTNIRPLNEGVSEIPAIPLTYFDPETAKFVTVHTEPIPIEVGPAKTLDLAAVVSANGSGRAIAPADRTDREGDQAVMFAANYGLTVDTLRHQPGNPGWTIAALSAGPLVWVLALAAWRIRRAGQDPAKAAARQARAELDRAGDPGSVRSALLSYLSAAFGLPIAMTPAEAAAALDGRLPASAARDCQELLTRCETIQYAPTGAVDPADLARRARGWIDATEKSR